MTPWSIADEAISAQCEPVGQSPARMIRTCNVVILLASMLNSFASHLNNYPQFPAILTNKNTRLRPVGQVRRPNRRSQII